MKRTQWIAAALFLTSFAGLLDHITSWAEIKTPHFWALVLPMLGGFIIALFAPNTPTDSVGNAQPVTPAAPRPETDGIVARSAQAMTNLMSKIGIWLLIVLTVGIVSCAGNTTPKTPAQIAYTVKTVGLQLEKMMTALGQTATGVRDVVRPRLNPDQTARFNDAFGKLQAAADSAITQIEAFTTGSAPLLKTVHDALTPVNDLFATFSTLVKSFFPTDTSLAGLLNAGAAFLQTALTLSVQGA